MNSRDRILYHQIHPAKLAVDWSFGILSLVPFWNHQPVLAVLLAFGPSALASYLLVKHVDLSSYRSSPFGRYMSAHMSGLLQIVRLAGFILMALGAWHHDVLIIALGLALILLAWLNGIFVTRLRRSIRITRTLGNRTPPNLPR